MKQLILTIALGLTALCGRAEIGDAMKGVWPVTDPAMMRSLNGEWLLKVVKGIDDKREVPTADATWGRIPVPGCWESYGFCEPKYDYPDSLTGYYRTEFTVPEAWKGQQVFIRLDGVLRGYDLWLNDQLVGTWESAYNTCLFDLTPYLRKKGAQQLAMRVYTQFKGYEFDCFDDWATNGIFRDVTLMAVPQTHLSDLTVTTRMNGEVTVKTEVANGTKQTTVTAEVTPPTAPEGASIALKSKHTAGNATTFLFDANTIGYPSGNERGVSPLLWTAETPYLYTLKVYVKEKGKTLQTFTQKIGIKEYEIEGNILKLNGRPIKLRGVNAHSTDPRTVKVISDDLTLKDMRMMKEASVNYMRLSHYPREPRFYELADSLGFYLVSEVPFGYGDKHLSGRSYQDILMTRANATVRRDKNHPSVLVWSVGNENPLPKTCVEVGDYVGQLDPSRPYCYPQVGSYFRRFWEKAAADSTFKGHPFPSKAPIYAPHYPSTGQMGGFYQRLDRPVIFTEYCHTLGISFEDHDRQWEIIERTPGIAGGSVWEWADQGMPFETSTSPSTGSAKNHYGYEERVFTSENGGFEMYGNKGTDGLVYADRTPLPNYYELQHNYARAFVSEVRCAHDAAHLTIHNRYDFLNLKDNVSFHWALTEDRDTVARGAFSPDCSPRSTTPYTLTLPVQYDQSNATLSMLHFEMVDAKGLVFLHQSFPLSKLDANLLMSETHGKPLPVQGEPMVRVGRKPTLAEMLKVKDDRVERYLQPLQNAYVKATLTNDESDNVSYSLTADTAHVFFSELGVAYLLAPAIDRVQWLGNGPFASYPGRRQANRYGCWSLHKDDLYFEGNRMGVDACWLSDKDGNGVLITGDSLNINFEQTDRGIVVTVNAAVSGQGPKFARTAFPVWGDEVGTVSGTFRLQAADGNDTQKLQRLFGSPQHVPAPRKPFVTQYDTYLMRFDDITGGK